jgi:hypothetical protein
MVGCRYPVPLTTAGARGAGLGVPNPNMRFFVQVSLVCKKMGERVEHTSS